MLRVFLCNAGARRIVGSSCRSLLRHVFALCRSHSRKTFCFGYKITALVCVGQYLKKGILFSCSLHISKAFYTFATIKRVGWLLLANPIMALR